MNTSDDPLVGGSRPDHHGNGSRLLVLLCIAVLHSIALCVAAPRAEHCWVRSRLPLPWTVIAQWFERLPGVQEVVGSIPHYS